ncbi:class I SAM-dependent methyltransferase [Pseudomonas yangonensis]|uniref:class I SAM-dependent methyltransferase n=1 Tax=Pseudomonas yangonensis TaxID=2579922 RepID=UPI001379956A|nr:class I SAM-dependent methyltransferase [Pseudomonas yangonensis]
MTDPVSKLSSSRDWDLKWGEVFDKYQADLRHAYYIRALKLRDEQRLLEIAAGSFRDMAALNRMGIHCSGADFSPEAVSLARERFPSLASQIYEMDAFRFDFPDQAFDLTYHNGFWGLFSTAEMIALAREQARISRRRMVATVHNAHNVQFKDYFERTAPNDPLFNIKFFYCDEIFEVMRSVCRRVTVVPVGKAKKRHEDRLIRWGLGQGPILNAYLKASGTRFLEQSERLLCIGEL